MQIVQTLESIYLNTDDVSLFQYFKDIITKNFTKVIGRKNKILSFFEESEIPQRRYFLKLINSKFKDDVLDESFKDAYSKTFKLNLKQENALKPMLFIKVEFEAKSIIFKFSSNEKLFATYAQNYFKEHESEYNETNSLLIIKHLGEQTFELFEAFANESEHLKYCVNFDINRSDYKKFRQNINQSESMKWKFNALAKLFSSYFTTLECTPANDLSEIRQKYLVLVKLYHPDFYSGKSAIEKAYCREQFEKVQIAYDNLKALYKNNT